MSLSLWRHFPSHLPRFSPSHPGPSPRQSLPWNHWLPESASPAPPIHSVAVHPPLPTHFSPPHLSFTLCRDLQGLEGFICSHSAPLRPKTTLAYLYFLPVDSIHMIHPLNQSLAYPLGSFSPLEILLHQLSKATTQICPGNGLLSSKPELLSCAKANHPSCMFMVSNLCWVLSSARRAFQVPMNHLRHSVPSIASVPFWTHCSTKIAPSDAQSVF